jgi:hypothetical protein
MGIGVFTQPTRQFLQKGDRQWEPENMAEKQMLAQSSR